MMILKVLIGSIQKKYGNYKIISAGNSGGCGKLYGFLNRNNAGITTNLIKFL
jgi:ABC-type uncharacterized transport system ATPase subunit